jgi:4-hydroxybutyrate CoA-transferase
MAAAIDRLQSQEWRKQLGSKLVTAEEAVSHVKSGARVALTLAQSTPHVLCAALAARLMDLEGVVINHSAALFDWNLPGIGERFRYESCYVSPIDRAIHTRGPAEFTPVSYYRAGTLPPAIDGFDTFLMICSPPNKEGYVSLGDAQIMTKLLAQNAKLVIAEVDERAIWTGGDNTLQVSEIDYFVERAEPVADLTAPPVPPQEKELTNRICELVAHELVPDRASIQVGVGSTSGVIMPHFKDHHDLGMQTEIIPWGTTPLVRDGVITGKYKKIFPELVVGAGFAVATPREELDYADGNPVFQLYDFNTTDDIRLIAREEGLYAINNGLAIDLTGQVDAESIGPQMYTGTGGQTAFAIGAVMGGGTSITVIPSSAMRNGKRISRITAMLPEGSVVTVPRTFVHYVVTEYGIATLKGKSIRDRARELIAVAHPDFREELRDAAKRLWG